MEVTPEGILCFSIFLKHKTGHTSPLLKPFMFPIALALKTIHHLAPDDQAAWGEFSQRGGSRGLEKEGRSPRKGTAMS